MQRRKFLRNASLAGASVFAAKAGAADIAAPPMATADKPFNLNYAIHDGLFAAHAGKDIVDQLKFAHERGFRAYEDNDMRLRPVERQKELGDALAKLGMKMGVIVGHSLDWHKPTLSRNDKEVNEKFQSEIREAVEIAKRCGATQVVVVPGVMNHHSDIAYQRTQLMDILRRAVDVLGKNKLTMLLEPLNFRDHPSQLLPDIPNIHHMIRSINSEYCKILFDIYHVQIHSGNIIPNIDMVWDDIAYFQVADNPGRLEPYTGEINYNNIFQHIYNKGFRGVVGMEHGSSMQGKEGELKVINAYRKSDDFEIKNSDNKK